MTAGFKPGDTFTHAFFDHVTLTSGPQGAVLLKDQRDMAALVVGTHGKGRVVLNGMLPGYASAERGSRNAADRQPEGGELQILINAIQWLTGNKP